MDLVAELNNQDTKRKKFQVLRMFLSILEHLQWFQGLLILLWHELQVFLYGSKFPLFGHSDLQSKLHFRNKKYNWGTLPRVREVFLNLAVYQEIEVQPHYCIINIGFQGYFEWSILSWYRLA